MRNKWYVVYVVVMTVVCGIGLVVFTQAIDGMQTKLVQAQESETVNVDKDQAVQAKARESAERVQRYKAEAARQARQLELAVAALTPPEPPKPRPAPVIGFAPNGEVSGRVYSNRDFKPGTVLRQPPLPPAGEGYLIVDFSPTAANGLDWKEAVRSKRCAAFSFVDAGGKTVNRLYCPPSFR